MTVISMVSILLPPSSERVAPRETAVVSSAEAVTTQAEPEPDADTSHLQWSPPQTGGHKFNEYYMHYVPLGTQVVVHLNPAALVQHVEGEKVLSALGPWGTHIIAQIEQLTGAKLTEMKSLVVAVHRGDTGWHVTFRVHLLKPWTNEMLDERTVNVPSGRAVFLPETRQGFVLVSCPQEVHQDLVDYGDMPTELPRDLERLYPLTDVDRMITVLMPRKFLVTEGRELFIDGGEHLLAAFDALVPDNASALAASATFDGSFVGNEWQGTLFWELAATIVQNAPAHRFNAKLTSTLGSAPDQVTDALASSPPHPYGKAVQQRFPAMLRAMSDYTRTSQQDGMAIIRGYLPASAAHNLLLAIRLSLESYRDDRSDSDAPVAATPLSVAQRLDQPTSLAFPQETLEKALEMLADDLQLPIQIAGRDLQLEGITRNQSFSLNMRDRPAREILLEILRQANPDREATGPADPRQKLVYVVRDNTIIVTTRKAAIERGDNLPEVFRATAP